MGWLKQPTKGALLSVLKKGDKIDTKSLAKIFDGVLFKSEFVSAAVGGTVDHTALSNIGTKTHAQIDTHIGTSSIHFTKASIDHTGILNIGTNSHAAIDLHIGDGTIHFTEGSIDHGSVSGLGDDDHTQYLILASRTTTSLTDSPSARNYTIFCDATSNAVTINLPTAVGLTGKVYNIKAINVDNAVTVDADGTEEIDGSTTPITLALMEVITIQSDGANWWII